MARISELQGLIVTSPPIQSIFHPLKSAKVIANRLVRVFPRPHPRFRASEGEVRACKISICGRRCPGISPKKVPERYELPRRRRRSLKDTTCFTDDESPLPEVVEPRLAGVLDVGIRHFTDTGLGERGVAFRELGRPALNLPLRAARQGSQPVGSLLDRPDRSFTRRHGAKRRARDPARTGLVRETGSLRPSARRAR
jgi:hypothetical protein